MISHIKNPDVISVRSINRFRERIFKGSIFFHLAVVILFSLSAPAWANAVPVNKTSAVAETFISEMFVPSGLGAGHG